MPFVSKDLPYFYNEDEAHHFNRLANMVKTGDFNPRYFHKPSLHFYARVPAFIGSFFYGVSKGHLKTVEEIKTGDPFGLNGYQMSASHPVLVKGNRIFSLGLSLATIALTFFVTASLFGGPVAPVISSLLVAISPGLIADSTTIGVDVLVTLLCLATLAFCLRIESSERISNILLAGLVCGLAISTKYNVWPLVILPIFCVAIFKRANAVNVAIALIAPAIGFIIGSPYILAELPLFLNNAAYEVWHYKIAGHAGNEAAPGLSQARHYASWIINSGTGLSFLIVAVLGSLISIVKPNKKAIAAIIFPVIYFTYMCSQKANFTRNMLPLLPFIAALGAGFLWYGSLLIKNNKRRLYLIIATPLMILPLFKAAINQYSEVKNTPRDSRSILMSEHLTEELKSEVALSGNLNVEPRAYGLKNVTRFDEKKTKPSDLFLQGFDQIIAGSDFVPSDQELKIVHLQHFIPGSSDLSRVVKSPAISIFKFSDNAKDIISLIRTFPEPECLKDEPHCWINNKITTIAINFAGLKASGDMVKLPLSLMTPWIGQKITFSIADWSQEVSFSAEQIGSWVDIELTVPLDKFALVSSIKCEISEVHSPWARKVGPEMRRLGVAIKGEALISR
jgi:hypothetical protein